VADAAGSDWPERARVAAVALVADSKRETPSLGIRLLSDLRHVFGDDDYISTEQIISKLTNMDEAPWADIGGKSMDSRSLANRLRRYDIKSRNVRIGTSIAKGYSRADLHEVWKRYLPPPAHGSATSATSATLPDDEPHIWD
jgi:hypothetical protein